MMRDMGGRDEMKAARLSRRHLLRRGPPGSESVVVRTPLAETGSHARCRGFTHMQGVKAACAADSVKTRRKTPHVATFQGIMQRKGIYTIELLLLLLLSLPPRSSLAHRPSHPLRFFLAT